MKLLHVVGARPNFMKLAPLFKCIRDDGTFKQILVHTGQHYDNLMSDIFFRQFQMPNPDYNLGVGSGTHTEQTAKVMLSLEQVFLDEKPDWLIVYGDVNSTLAASIVAAKLQIPIAHVESGLRSFDRTMPEEINRILTDKLSSLLFTPSQDGNKNLMQEGVSANIVHLVGNIMVDSLIQSLHILETNTSLYAFGSELTDKFNYDYALVTIHRPSNVDDPKTLQILFSELLKVSSKLPLILPLHPRTRKHLELNGVIQELPPNFYIIDPLGYFDFIFLQKNARFVLTDSGGVQEETTYLNVPCLTLRPNTERPVTITVGSNTLISDDYVLMHSTIDDILAGHYKSGSIPELWDGNTSQRILNIFKQL